MNIEELKISVELMTKYYELTGELPYEGIHSERSQKYIQWLERQVYQHILK